MFLFSLADIIQVPFGYLMGWLYQFTNNYGVALILFAVIVQLILLPMTTSRAVWVIVGLLVIAVGVLMAIDRLKPGKLLGDGGNIIDAQ